jgi:predicted DNA-binding transcriptional regulator AlpA
MDRILNERTTAQALSLSVKCLQAWRRQKRGPAYLKMGRAIGYRESDLDAWLRKSRVATTEQK